MLKLPIPTLIIPDRASIVGQAGFVGKDVLAKLLGREQPVAGIGHQNIDPLSEDALQRLILMLRSSDGLVMIAAQAPVKTNNMHIDNLRMMAAVHPALASVSVEHVIYVNSDTVNADADARLSETSYTHPVSIYGVMHLVREIVPADVYKSSMGFLRPTCIQGAADPYDGYNPLCFGALQIAGRKQLFLGRRRAARLCLHRRCGRTVALSASRKSYGILNMAPRAVTSFSGIAEKVAGMVLEEAMIRARPRSGPTLPRGYRAFNASSTAPAFPDFHYSPLGDGLRLSQKREFSNG